MIDRHHDDRLELSSSITADFHYDEGNKRASRFRLTYIFMAKYERLFQNECRTKEKKWGEGGGERKKKKNREDPVIFVRE